MTAYEVNDKFTIKMFDYKSSSDYYYNSACSHRIPNIKVPTFFINALDDPVVGEKGIDYKVFNDHPHCILATTQYGGHVSYYESSYSSEQWIVKPVLDFLYIFR